MASSKALILLNMGGPNNLDEVKVFLTNMFNDRRIISAPNPIRKMIAWLITSRRLKESQHNYSLIGEKSPIGEYTRRVVKELSKHIDADVHYVMRYTPPYTDEVLRSVTGHDEIYALPLYPHFSSTTTLSSFDALFDEAKKLGISHKIKTLESYYNEPSYITSIVERIKEALDDEDPAEYIGMSASKFIHHDPKTLDMLEYKEDIKMRKLTNALTKVREKYGMDIVRGGGEL